MAKKPISESVHILVHLEDGVWIAHCLEFDLLADGKDPKSALTRLLGVIETHINYIYENGLIDELYQPAPVEYWRKLARAQFAGEIKVPARAAPRFPDLRRTHNIKKSSTTPHTSAARSPISQFLVGTYSW